MYHDELPTFIIHASPESYSIGSQIQQNFSPPAFTQHSDVEADSRFGYVDDWRHPIVVVRMLAN
jgi:hypothetical protein